MPIATSSPPADIPGHGPHFQHHAQPPYAQGPYPIPVKYSSHPPLDVHERAPPQPSAHSHQSGPMKRIASSSHPAESPVKKKQSKWSADEDAAIIELRGNGMKWEDISKNLPGRSAISCRLRFQNYLERRSEWDEEKKNKLARLYERFKKDMWEKIAKEMALPWRAAEAMHWQIGEVEMANRANVPVFHLAGNHAVQQIQVSTTTADAPFTPATDNRSSSASPYSAAESLNNPYHFTEPGQAASQGDPSMLHGHTNPWRKSDTPTSDPKDNRPGTAVREQSMSQSGSFGEADVARPGQTA